MVIANTGSRAMATATTRGGMCCRHPAGDRRGDEGPQQPATGGGVGGGGGEEVRTILADGKKESVSEGGG